MHTRYILFFRSVSRLTVRRYFFVERVVSVWNSLSFTVHCTSLAPFKHTVTHLNLNDFLDVLCFFMSAVCLARPGCFHSSRILLGKYNDGDDKRSVVTW